MTFTLKQMKHTVKLHPRFLGPELMKHLDKELIRSVEGTCAGSMGYIVCVTKVLERGEGVIDQTTASATFVMKYEALILRPCEGEVIDAVVTTVNKMGFFCESGPLDIFVSNYMIPEDMEFNSVGEPCYKSSTDETTVEKDVELRVRIVGKRIDPEELFCIGTIKDDFLGPYSNSNE